jgi:hypothetical protein
MTQYWKFYLPEAHPTGLDAQVGGTISANELEPQLSYLFSPMETDDVSDKAQYRKVFAKQVEAGTFQNVSIELANVEYTGQVSFAIADQTGYAPTAQTLPDVYDGVSNPFSGNSTQALTGIDISSQNDTIGVWIKQSLEADVGSDDLASFTIRVRATKL